MEAPESAGPIRAANHLTLATSLQVDDRLNGDGAGIPFGVNEPVLGAHLLGVATTIWALYYIAQSTGARRAMQHSTPHARAGLQRG